MPKKVQVTLTGNESKLLIARAALRLPEVQHALAHSKVLLIGGTTVSALAEALGYAPMRISGRIVASGTRTAPTTLQSAHSLLIQDGKAVNADKQIRQIVEEMTEKDLIIVGANAMDPHGRAALAFASVDGGSRGYALHDAHLRGVPMRILCGLNKLVPDLGPAVEHSGWSDIEASMGAAIGLYPVSGSIVTEIEAYEILCGVQAVVIAGDGIASGAGSRTFVLIGEEETVRQAWELTRTLKGARLSGDRDSLAQCYGGCDACGRHVGCMYKAAAEEAAAR